MKSLLALTALAIAVSPAASVAVWGQCGGQDYHGDTVCDTGSTCTFNNQYYELKRTVLLLQFTRNAFHRRQRLLEEHLQPPLRRPLQAVLIEQNSNTSVCMFTDCVWYLLRRNLGVNQSGGCQTYIFGCAEFGQTIWPGTYGKEFIFPAPSSIDFFVSKGFNFFRIPFQMERLVPPATGIAGPFASAYLANLTASINYITNTKGAFAALDPHNFMNYNNAPISSTADFQKFWTNLAGQFKSNTKVIFDVMNEPNTIPASTAFALNQAAVNGIRASGATSQLILVEAWTGAWTWVSSGNAAVFGAIKDPNNNVAIGPIEEMHQYLDSDGSGTSATCVSSTIGAERLAAATAWLKANNLKGFLGEIGAGSNAACISAISGALCSMQQSGVWIGAAYWAAGPWWGTYFQSIEPPSGASVSQILPQALMPYL
ncbi:endoglucanase [Mycena rebaudengoi]|nr:endoglucanase [Mycena rebaudengoi]